MYATSFVPTTLLEPRRLASHLGLSLRLASETFQHTGSFKFRAAYNLAAHSRKAIPSSPRRRAILGKRSPMRASFSGRNAIIVMPETSAQVKMDAVREHGGRVVAGRRHRSEPSRQGRLKFAERAPGRRHRQRLRRPPGHRRATPPSAKSSRRSTSTSSLCPVGGGAA